MANRFIPFKNQGEKQKQPVLSDGSMGKKIEFYVLVFMGKA
jgi:hypothetical protein